MDHLVIFSLPQHGLQEKPYILEKHYRQWDLELNLKKTRVIIFNKQGSTIKKYMFYYTGKEIEIASQITHLGFIFIPPGKNMLVLKM